MRPAIPVIDGTPIDLLNRQLPAARALLAEARRRYTPRALDMADRLSRRWLAARDNPYLAEMDAMLALMGESGAHMLNLSYEWGCTTGLASDGTGMRLLRTLDWPLTGLGRHVAVLRTEAPAGPVWSATWPGFSGTLTALAPGRFAVALNQVKSWHGRLPQVLAWPVKALRQWRSPHLPPAHLLRQVCETAPDYATAVRRLAETPVCQPVLFSIVGTAPDQGCVIERGRTGAFIHAAPVACANHWRFPGLKGRHPGPLARADDRSAYVQASRSRLDAMTRRMTDENGDMPLAWLSPPILTDDTRLACVLRPTPASLTLVGLEARAPATHLLHLSAEG